MGSGSYYIKVDEVDRMKTDYLTYEGSMQEALEKVAASVQAVGGLETFQGVSAQSVKAYFQEVHLPLVDMLNKLVEQLETDCSKEYSEGFFKSPVSAGLGACLPEREMSQIEKSLQSMIDGDLAEAGTYVQTAVRCLPAGVSFSVPNPEPVKLSLGHEKEMIRKTREGVRDLEDRGYAALAAQDGAFQEALASLGAAISACASGSISIATYTSGGFSAVMDSTGLRSAYQKCVNDQAINREKVLEARENCLDREQVRIKEAEEKAAQEKAFWCGIGLIASTVVLVAGIAATVATAGAASPLLLVATGLGTYKSATNTFSRAAQYGAVLGGNKRADQDDFRGRKLDETAGDISDGAERTDGFLGTIGVAREGKSDKALDGGFGLLKDFGGDAIDASFDYVKENVEEDWLKTVVDVVNEGVDEAYDQIVDGGFDGLGVVSAAGKATEAIADYHVDKADKKLEELEERSEKLEDLREGFKSGPAPTYSSMW